jgi:hypothetical protein
LRENLRLWFKPDRKDVRNSVLYLVFEMDDLLVGGVAKIFDDQSVLGRNLGAATSMAFQP